MIMYRLSILILLLVALVWPCLSTDGGSLQREDCLASVVEVFDAVAAGAQESDPTSQAKLAVGIMMCYLRDTIGDIPEPCVSRNWSETSSECIEQFSDAQYSIFSTFMQHLGDILFLLRTEVIQKRSLAKIIDGNEAFEEILQTQTRTKEILEKHRAVLDSLEIIAPSLTQLDELLAPTWKVLETVDSVVKVVNTSLELGGAIVNTANSRIVSMIAFLSASTITLYISSLMTRMSFRIMFVLSIGAVISVIKFAIGGIAVWTILPASWWYWIGCASFWIVVITTKFISSRKAATTARKMSEQEITSFVPIQEVLVAGAPRFRISSRRNLSMQYDDLCRFGNTRSSSSMTSRWH